jgi:hypothetical protein
VNVNVSSSRAENAYGENFFERAFNSISRTSLARSVGSFVSIRRDSKDLIIGRANTGRLEIGFDTFAEDSVIAEGGESSLVIYGLVFVESEVDPAFKSRIGIISACTNRQESPNRHPAAVLNIRQLFGFFFVFSLLLVEEEPIAGGCEIVSFVVGFFLGSLSLVEEEPREEDCEIVSFVVGFFLGSLSLVEEEPREEDCEITSTGFGFFFLFLLLVDVEKEAGGFEITEGGEE